MKQFKSLKDSGVLIKCIIQTTENEIKEQRGGFRSMMLGTLGASLLGNVLSGKAVI